MLESNSESSVTRRRVGWFPVHNVDFFALALVVGSVHGDGRHGWRGAGVGPAHLQEASLVSLHHSGT